MGRKKQIISLDTEVKPDIYRVRAPNGESVFFSEDIFKSLDMLKQQSPGAKMYRDSDDKLLAYTTTPKFDLEDPDRARKHDTNQEY